MTVPSTLRTRASSRLRAWRSRSERPWDATSRLGLMFFCAALYIGLGIKYANFLTADNFFITLLSVTSIGVAAIGMTALLISGNVDLSIGGQYAFISMVTAIVARDSQNTALAILTGLACGTALGYTNGRLVRLLRINPLIVTLGVGIVLHGFAFVICSGLSVYGFPGRFVRLGQTYFGPVPLPVVVGGIVFLVASIVLLRTVGGLRTYAIGGNANAARLSGIDVDRFVTGLFAINGTHDRPRLGHDHRSARQRLADRRCRLRAGRADGGDPRRGRLLRRIGPPPRRLRRGVHDRRAQRRDHLRGSRRISGSRSFREARCSSPSLPINGARTDARRDAPLRRSTAPRPSRKRLQSRSTRAPPRAGEVVVACEGLTKYFGSVQAAQDVGFVVHAGEVVCLVGDNGAGKSTVIRMLSGATRPDSGRISVEGEAVDFQGPADAQARGIATAYQDLALCPNLGVAENLVLGREPRKTNWGILSWRDDRRVRWRRASAWRR